jgi:pantetheine-phosphate adenylyltransferase
MLLGDVTVVVCTNLDKEHMFTQEERVEMVSGMVKDMQHVMISELPPGDMISTFISNHDCKVLVRGLRNSIDMEYERPLEMFMKEYGIEEVVYLLNDPDLAYITSSLVRNHLLVLKSSNNISDVCTLNKYLPQDVADIMRDILAVKFQ